MERFPNPRFNEFRALLDLSDRLIRRSEQIRAEFAQLSRHLANLNADSEHLIEHSRRLNNKDRVRPTNF